MRTRTSYNSITSPEMTLNVLRQAINCNSIFATSQSLTPLSNSHFSRCNPYGPFDKAKVRMMANYVP